METYFRVSEQLEEICVRCFLNWYNEQYKRNYIHQRAEIYFTELKNGLRWEFVAYERDNPGNWIAIEVKELPTSSELGIRFEYWRDFCEELTKDLECKIEGKFEVHLPPSLNVKQKEQQKLREAFIEVLCNKESILKADESTDIGPDIAGRFINWPKKKSNIDEYNKFGEYRPCKLLIVKSADSGCEVKPASSPLIGGSVPEMHREALNKVFNTKCVKANKQLELAKSKGATKTILLLACSPFDNESLIRSHVQNLNRPLISDIDCMYLVDISSKDRVVRIYPDY